MFIPLYGFRGVSVMVKKLFYSFLIVVFILVSCVPVFAAPVYDKDTTATEAFYVSITSPQPNESTLKKACFISGSTELKGIRVELYIFNSETGTYEPLVTSDGVSSFEIGASGIFIKEADLPRFGENKILLVAYPKPEKVAKDTKKDEPEKEELKKEQRSILTVTVLKENWKDIIKNGIDDIKQILKDMKVLK